MWILRTPGPLEVGGPEWDAWLDGTGGGEVLGEGGRRPPRVVDLPGSGVGIVRRYLRGGLLAVLGQDRHRSERRPLRELEVSEALRRGGIRTPEILGLYWRKDSFGFVRACLVTRRIPKGRNLRQWVREEGIDRERRREMLAEVAASVAALHAAGCIHRDLNLGNLLWTGEALHILDLDGGRIVRTMKVRDRGNNLLRLYRSLAKETRRVEPLTLRERLRFLADYAVGDVRLRRDLRTWLARRWGRARWRRVIRRRFGAG